jgi:hypothetical protein
VHDVGDVADINGITDYSILNHDILEFDEYTDFKEAVSSVDALLAYIAGHIGDNLLVTYVIFC